MLASELFDYTDAEIIVNLYRGDTITLLGLT